MDDTTEPTGELEKRLAKHPGLRTHVERLLDEVENRAGQLNTADEAEDAVVTRVRELGRMALQRWAEERARAVQPSPQPGWRRGGKKKLCWLSTLGPITLFEQLWREGARSRRPLCEAARMVAHGASRRLQRAVCDFAADEAFASAAEKLREHYGLAIAVERVRRTCLRHAHRLAARAPVATRTLAAAGAAAIVAEADGTMIPTVDCTAAPPGSDRRKHRRTAWQEMRLVAACAQGEVQVHYGAGFDTAETTGRRWSEVVGQAHWAAHTFIHGVGDGAEWISEQFRQHFGAHGRYTLDLFHACDYLAAAAPASTPDFVAQQREALQRNAHAEVIAELATRLESPAQPEEQAPVRAAHRYLSNRVEQLDYQAALRHDLPVGSGLIESGHRHVLQARLKKSGAWWTRDNAHAIAHLRVTRANHGWDDYWTAN